MTLLTLYRFWYLRFIDWLMDLDSTGPCAVSRSLTTARCWRPEVRTTWSISRGWRMDRGGRDYWLIDWLVVRCRWCRWTTQEVEDVEISPETTQEIGWYADGYTSLTVCFCASATLTRWLWLSINPTVLFWMIISFLSRVHEIKTDAELFSLSWHPSNYILAYAINAVQGTRDRDRATIRLFGLHSWLLIHIDWSLDYGTCNVDFVANVNKVQQ